MGELMRFVDPDASHCGSRQSAFCLSHAGDERAHSSASSSLLLPVRASASFSVIAAFVRHSLTHGIVSPVAQAVHFRSRRRRLGTSTGSDLTSSPDCDYKSVKGFTGDNVPSSSWL